MEFRQTIKEYLEELLENCASARLNKNVDTFIMIMKLEDGEDNVASVMSKSGADFVQTLTEGIAQVLYNARDEIDVEKFVKDLSKNIRLIMKEKASEE